MDKIRIALADDHNMVRKGIISMLSSDHDFKVVAEAPNGRELLRLIAELPELPQVCLLDISMPDMDGYATLVALKQLYPAMQFLILSQFDDEFVIIKMLKAGASGYLNKDADPQELKDAIRVILSGAYFQNDMVNGRIFSLVRRNDNDGQLVLSDNELSFLKYSCSELTYKEIADRMGVSKRTVEGYRERLFDKLGVKSRTALAMYALKIGLNPADEQSEVTRRGTDSPPPPAA